MKKLTFIFSFVLLVLSLGAITQGQYQSWRSIRDRK